MRFTYLRNLCNLWMIALLEAYAGSFRCTYDYVPYNPHPAPSSIARLRILFA